MSSTSTTLRWIGRLCLKELRESLRDRRTIVTLVLMPLLVYPLLSMILQRLLLTSSQPQTQQVIRIGISDRKLEGELKLLIDAGRISIINRGETMMVARDAPPAELDSEENDGPPTPKPPNLPDGRTLDSLSSYALFLIDRDPIAALKSGEIDVLVTESPSNSQSAGTTPTAESPTPKDNSTNDSSIDNTNGGDERVANESSRIGPDGKPIAGDSNTNFPRMRYQIDYVENDTRSERGVRFFQSLFAAANEQFVRNFVQQTGGRYRPVVRMTALPLKIQSDSPTMFASLVPLVLVLMTIAGAVYPAIDLTAGERERGTLEAMIVSPTPRPILLLAKYAAVVTVAMLTAVANLTAMSITLWAGGFGKLLLGGNVFTLTVVIQILALLVLFAMFFSAVLLAITSFAKSFKEAQAYLIPVMLISLAPGILSLLPNVGLTNLLATVPLVNIVLLSRDLLVGGASWETGGITIICTAIYAVAAIALAGRMFGNDASLHGSQGSWRDLITRPEEVAPTPSVVQMAMTMAVLFPLYFIASTSLPKLGGSLAFRLSISAVVSWLLIWGLPTVVSLFRRIDFRSTFILRAGRFREWLGWGPAAVLLAASLWMFGHEMMLILQSIGIATFGPEQMKQAQVFADALPTIPIAVVLFAGAVTPAICEEWFFRGFVMASLRQFGKWSAIFGSALLFGLMHVLTSNIVAVERFFPSAMMGLVLGWIAWESRSLLPGMLLHMLHNGFLLSVGVYKDQLKDWGWGVEEQSHLPWLWLVAGAGSLAVGIVLMRLVFRSSKSTATESNPA
ncbi:MAG: ABC transporter permease subunit [Pirellulales bacterium]